MMREEEFRVRFMLDHAQEVLRELANNIRLMLLDLEHDPSEELERLLCSAEILSANDPDDPHAEEPMFTTCESCDRLNIPITGGVAVLECDRCLRDGDEAAHATWTAITREFEQAEYEPDPSPYDGTYSEE